MMRLFRCLFLALLPLALSSCAGGGGAGLGQLDLGMSAQQIAERTAANGALELILEPVDAWDAQGAGGLEQLAVQGEDMLFRLRQTESFDRASVRLGLYWNSRQQQVHMPVIIVGGGKVRIQKVRISADGYRETLEPSRNFNFTPATRLFEKAEELHPGVFSLSPDTLAKIVAAREVAVTLTTNRGGLRVNLSVVTDTSPTALKESGRYQFAEFYRRMQAQR